MKSLLFLIIFALLAPGLAQSMVVGEAATYRCIVGEAADQGQRGMTAVAEAIRNRGHLGGVYGCKSKLYDKEPQWVRDMAVKAWHDSADTNLVEGANHWENIKAFGTPYWAEGQTAVATVGDHKFYKL